MARRIVKKVITEAEVQMYFGKNEFGVFAETDKGRYYCKINSDGKFDEDMVLLKKPKKNKR